MGVDFSELGRHGFTTQQSRLLRLSLASVYFHSIPALVTEIHHGHTDCLLDLNLGESSGLTILRGPKCFCFPSTPSEQDIYINEPMWMFSLFCLIVSPISMITYPKLID